MPWQWSAFGVDLFFTLSSFLITTLLLRESSVCGALDVTAFYLRRVLRILPLYFGFLLAATTLARSLVPDENLPLKYVVAFCSVMRQQGLCPVGLSTQRGEPPVVRFH